MSLALLVLAVSPTTRFINGLFDDTFAGIHQLAGSIGPCSFPYFTVLIVLSVYGIHRYDMIRTYFKYRKNATTDPPARFAQLPPVTIQLPLYNERYVVERLIEEAVKIEYPEGTAANPGAGRFHRRHCALCRSPGGAVPRPGLSHRIPPSRQSRRL